MNYKKNQNGFTLVEVVLTGFLLTLVLGAIYSFVNTSQRFYSKTSEQADIQAQLRVIMLGLKNELATAQRGSLKLSTVKPPTVPSGENWFYIKDNITGENFPGIVRHTSPDVVRPAFAAIRLPDLSIDIKPMYGDIDVGGGAIETRYRPQVSITLTSGNYTLTEEFALLNESVSVITNSWRDDIWTLGFTTDKPPPSVMQGVTAPIIAIGFIPQS